MQRAKSLERKQKNAHSRYIYVICDEAHFFTSDAMFNPHTAKILSAIVRLFQDAIRVYMSATPYECLEYIIKEEVDYKRRYLNWNKPQHKWITGPMVFYHFKRDYSYLDVKAYSKISELFEIIAKSVHQDKKRWLIFIDDKQRCADIKIQLEDYGEEHGYPLIIVDKDGVKTEMVLAVNAGSKKDKIYMEMVKSEKLGKDTYVLITTSVLDNGVNLRNIDNIVVSDMSKVKCLQMVGRARVSGEDDRKTLYIKRFGGGKVDDRIKAFKKQQAAYHSYNLAFGEFHDSLRSRKTDINEFIDKYYHGSDDDWHDAKHWFGHPVDDATKLYFNEIAKSLLDRLVPQYQAIYNEMLEEGPKADEPQARERVNRTGQKYLEYQFSWFGKTYCKDDDMTFADKDKDKKAFIVFLEEYADGGKIIEGKEQMDAFKADFRRLHDAVYPSANKDKTHPYGHKVMNDILKDRGLGYEITGLPTKGPWKVVRANTVPEGLKS